MTTKPKAKKFRIRRTSPTSGGDGAEAREVVTTAPEAEKPAPVAEAARPRPMQAEPPKPAAPSRPAATPKAEKPAEAEAKPTAPARTGEVSSAKEVAGETDIDAIRKEGLTGRQLRMARRVLRRYNCNRWPSCLWCWQERSGGACASLTRSTSPTQRGRSRRQPNGMRRSFWCWRWRRSGACASSSRRQSPTQRGPSRQ